MERRYCFAPIFYTSLERNTGLEAEGGRASEELTSPQKKESTMEGIGSSQRWFANLSINQDFICQEKGAFCEGGCEYGGKGVRDK